MVQFRLDADVPDPYLKHESYWKILCEHPSAVWLVDCIKRSNSDHIYPEQIFLITFVKWMVLNFGEQWWFRPNGNFGLDFVTHAERFVGDLVVSGTRFENLKRLVETRNAIDGSGGSRGAAAVATAATSTSGSGRVTASAVANATQESLQSILSTATKLNFVRHAILLLKVLMDVITMDRAVDNATASREKSRCEVVVSALRETLSRMNASATRVRDQVLLEAGQYNRTVRKGSSNPNVYYEQVLSTMSRLNNPGGGTGDGDTLRRGHINIQSGETEANTCQM